MTLTVRYPPDRYSVYSAHQQSSLKMQEITFVRRIGRLHSQCRSAAQKPPSAGENQSPQQTDLRTGAELLQRTELSSGLQVL